MTDHTPTPWLADPDDRPGYKWNLHVVEASDPDMRICFMSAGTNSEANAAFIVQAVNSYYAMFEALEAIAMRNQEFGYDAGKVARETLTRLVG